jgi:hypothetical protein
LALLVDLFSYCCATNDGTLLGIENAAGPSAIPSLMTLMASLLLLLVSGRVNAGSVEDVECKELGEENGEFCVLFSFSKSGA